MITLIEVGRYLVALADTPDYLEKIGILARSEGSTTRKQPAPPAAI